MTEGDAPAPLGTAGTSEHSVTVTRGEIAPGFDRVVFLRRNREVVGRALAMYKPCQLRLCEDPSLLSSPAGIASVCQGPAPVLVSACLLGFDCRYAGDSKRQRLPDPFPPGSGEYTISGPLPGHLPAGWSAAAAGDLEDYELVPCCPEVFGGLPTPRPPAEWKAGGRLINSEGDDVTLQYELGARRTLGVGEERRALFAVLKRRSPSCGVSCSHEEGRVVPRPGCTAQALLAAGYTCVESTE